MRGTVAQCEQILALPREEITRHDHRRQEHKESDVKQGLGPFEWQRVPDTAPTAKFANLIVRHPGTAQQLTQGEDW